MGSNNNDNDDKQNKPTLFILYGSATGNAEHIAKDLAKNAESASSEFNNNNNNIICCELDQFKKKGCLKIWETPTAKKKHAVLIICSTTGNGDAPENASRFFRHVKRKTTCPNLFQHCQYAILGLGDTNYDQFCASGKLLDKKLHELGGCRLQQIACADEATGLEEVVEPWTCGILQKVANAWNNDGGDDDGDGATTTSKVDRQQEKVDDEDPTTTTITTTTTTTSDNGDGEGSEQEEDTPVMIEEQEEEDRRNDDEPKQPSANNAPSTTTSLIPTPSPRPPVTSTSNTNVSLGVRLIQSLFQKPGDDANDDDILNSIDIDPTTLPNLMSKRSSCELVVDYGRRQQRSMSVGAETSSSISSGFHYNINNPFASKILNARYLTQTTNTDAARQVVEVQQSRNNNGSSFVNDAYKIYDDAFPLLDKNKKNELHGKRVLELTLSLPDDYTLEYAPGDSLGMVVDNTPDCVEFVLDMLHKHHGVERTQMVSIDENHPEPVEDIMKSYLDLSSPIKTTRLLYAMSQIATDPTEACCLQLLSSKCPEGEQLFTKVVDEQRMNVVDLLRAFPSTQSITMEGLIGIVPAIPPRYYSVSSSPLKDKFSLTIAVSIVDYLTPSLLILEDDGHKQEEVGQKRIRGIASRYMEVLASSFLASGSTTTTSSDGDDDDHAATLRIFPKPTTDFRMPSLLTTPLVLIGPGTGIAPFMGFLEHRRALIQSLESTEVAQTVVEGTWRGGFEWEESDIAVSKHDESGLNVGADYHRQQIMKNIEKHGSVIDVFFGCRYEHHDWLYKDEMQKLKDEGIISNLFVAFSRDKDTKKHKYVQDIMLKDEKCAQRLVELIVQKEAAVYVCGDGNAMGKDVQNAIVTLLAQRHFGGGDDGLVQARRYFQEMKTSQRFLMDIWS